LVALISVRQVPHMIATIVCSFYCFARRGLVLTAMQKLELVRLTKLYNSISYPVGIGIVFFLAVPLIRLFNKRREEGPGSDVGSTTLAQLRRSAIRLPLRLACVNTFTWLPSIAIFTLATYHITHRFNAAGFAHFATAVVMSWLIATSYSSLYAMYF